MIRAPLLNAIGIAGDLTIPQYDSPTEPSVKQGFPPAYDNPSSAGGKYVSRSELNGFLYILSDGESRRQAGEPNTFSTARIQQGPAGYYAKGAILDYVVGGTIHKVISLHDGNNFDFTKNGVDNVHWKYCDPASTSMRIFPDVANAQTLFDGLLDVSSIASSGRVGGIFTLNSGADYLVTFGISTRVVGATTGADVDFCARNNVASSATEDWVPIQSCMWISTSTESTGTCFGSLYMHGGQSLAVVAKNISSFGTGGNCWLTLKAFPLTV